MDERIAKLNTREHQAAQELLPWFVTDRLSAAETAMVERHLLSCAQCRSDLAWQHTLRAANPQCETTPDVERALARLRPRLEALQRRRQRPALSALLRPFRGNPQWMRWALAVQAVIIVALLLALPYGDLAPYHGLSAPRGAGGNLVVMFKPDTTERELRQLLQETGARVVDGPTSADGYVLKVPDDQQAQAISLLRTKSAIELVEPLDAGGGR